METDPTVNTAKETFKLLGNLNYFFLWLGQTISQLGDSIYEMAIVWFALKLTGSPLSTGMVALAAALPYPILGLVAGAYVDRWNRKTTMIRADLLRAAVLVTIPVLSAFGALRVWHLAAAAFALTSSRVFFYPALMASLPAVVPKEQLVRANDPRGHAPFPRPHPPLRTHDLCGLGRLGPVFRGVRLRQGSLPLRRASGRGGTGGVCIDVPTEAFIQSTVPQDKMGKVFSVWSTTGFTGDALSAALAGPMVAWLGVSPAFAAGGVLVSLFGVVGFRTVGSPARGEKAGVASA